MGDVIELSGLGVHTGLPSRLAFSLRSNTDVTGPLFFFPGHAGPLAPRDLAALPRRARRASELGEGAGRIRTPEHLLAALLFFADLPIDVACDAAELPGLDGSALPYREALARLAPDRAARPAWREYPCGLAWEHAWKDGSLEVRPARNFQVTYEFSRGPLRQRCVLESAAQAWDGILPARSFVFHRDWRAAVDSGSGLMAGAGLDSGLLLAESETEHGALRAAHPEWPAGPFPLLNGSWRVAEELARHKVLDLLGDLAILGLGLPKIAIAIRNGGHAVNHLLLEKLSGN